MKRSPEAHEEWVAVARLLKPWGRRGELSAVSLSSHPERFEQLDEISLFDGADFPNQTRTFRVTNVWEHGPRLVFQFDGVDSISDAEKLRGAEVRVPMEERFPLPEGEYYHADLVGCRVIEASGSREIGSVRKFLEMGGNGLLEVVDERGREVLVPFTKSICVAIDVEKKRITVDPPDGLLDLNAE
jgi:16S rRNA processing protein RimM